MSELELAPLSAAVTVRADGADLAVESAGEGPSVVFLHAGVADRRSWRPVAAALMADHHVVAWDRRGFGDTVVDAPAPHDHVADAVAVLDALAIDRAVVVGNSQGGRTAMDLTLAHPDRVAGLMMVGAFWTGGPYPDEDPPEVEELGRQLQAAAQADEVDLVNQLEARVWLDGVMGRPGRVTGDARELFLDMNGRALDADDVGEEQAHEPSWDRLGEVTVPVTIVDGALDEPAAIDVGDRAAEVLTDVRRIVLDDVAHLPSLEQPLVLADLVRDLVERSR